MPSDAFKNKLIRLYELVLLTKSDEQQVMPDDHSEVVPLLPIPNRTVKRLRADDSAGSRVKVGHRQALTAENAPSADGAFLSELRFGVSIKTQKRARIQGFADRSEENAR